MAHSLRWSLSIRAALIVWLYKNTSFFPSLHHTSTRLIYQPDMHILTYSPAWVTRCFDSVSPGRAVFQPDLLNFYTCLDHTPTTWRLSCYRHSLSCCSACLTPHLSVLHELFDLTNITWPFPRLDYTTTAWVLPRHPTAIAELVALRGSVVSCGDFRYQQTRLNCCFYFLFQPIIFSHNNLEMSASHLTPHLILRWRGLTLHIP